MNTHIERSSLIAIPAPSDEPLNSNIIRLEANVHPHALSEPEQTVGVAESTEIQIAHCEEFSEESAMVVVEPSATEFYSGRQRRTTSRVNHALRKTGESERYVLSLSPMFEFTNFVHFLIFQIVEHSLTHAKTKALEIYAKDSCISMATTKTQ